MQPWHHAPEQVMSDLARARNRQTANMGRSNWEDLQRGSRAAEPFAGLLSQIGPYSSPVYLLPPQVAQHKSPGELRLLSRALAPGRHAFQLSIHVPVLLHTWTSNVANVRYQT